MNKNQAKSIKTSGFLTAVLILILTFVVISQVSGMLQWIVLIGGSVLAISTGNRSIALAYILEENIKTNEILTNYISRTQPEEKAGLPNINQPIEKTE